MKMLADTVGSTMEGIKRNLSAPLWGIKNGWIEITHEDLGTRVIEVAIREGLGEKQADQEIRFL